MERTSAIEGNEPVIIVAPHGPDDINTDIMAEKIAEELGSYAVINRGWKKSKTFDYWKDLADCNNVAHLHEDVIKEEFLDPIIKFKNKIKKKFQEDPFILIIHGCGNKVRKTANDHFLDMIVGSGLGAFSSCKSKIKNAFIHYLQKEDFGVYEGKNKYAGKSRNNLNQLFNFWYQEKNVNSLQLEIVKELRTEKDLFKATVEGITSAIDAITLVDDTMIFSSKDFKQI